MKKLFLTLLTASLLLTGCANTEAESEEPKVTNRYTMYGRYYTDGTIRTRDGHEWKYKTDLISERNPYDGMPVWVAFNDSGTPEELTDDVPLGLVYDVNTAIYDQLESALSEEFKITRDGNEIRIGGYKNDGNQN